MCIKLRTSAIKTSERKGTFHLYKHPLCGEGNCKEITSLSKTWNWSKSKQVRLTTNTSFMREGWQALNVCSCLFLYLIQFITLRRLQSVTSVWEEAHRVITVKSNLWILEMSWGRHELSKINEKWILTFKLVDAPSRQHGLLLHCSCKAFLEIQKKFTFATNYKRSGTTVSPLSTFLLFFWLCHCLLLIDKSNCCKVQTEKLWQHSSAARDK